MIHPLVVAPEDIYGRGYLKCHITNGVTKGTWALISGVWDVKGGPSGKEGWPGYANTGDIAVNSMASLGAVAATGLGADKDLVIVDKLEFQREDGDLDLKTLVSGEQVLCYKGGRFLTDQYSSTDTWTGVLVGARLFVNANGVLTTGWLSGQTVRARFLGLKGGYDTSLAERALMEFEVLRGTVTA